VKRLYKDSKRQQ